MALVIERVTANASAKPRHDTMEGKDYLVIPSIIMVEGVLNGSHGPIMYTSEHMAVNAWAWNYRPVVVYHPQKDGEYVSAASDPVGLTAHKVGVLMNTEFVEGVGGKPSALHSECWIDIERVKLIDNRILEAIEQGRMLELSTGLVSNDIETTGNWNGTAYNAVATNILPDHLAILPDQLGACSIEDGCGFMRVNTKDGEVLIHPKSDARARSLKRFEQVWANTLHEMSFTEIHSELWNVLSKKFGEKGSTWEGWVEEIFNGYVVFYGTEGKTFRHDYAIKNKSVKLIGKPREVQRVIDYEPVTNAKELDMSKDIMVDALIANDHTNWAEEDRSWLSDLEEVQLEKMEFKSAQKKSAAKENTTTVNCPCLPGGGLETEEVTKTKGNEMKTPSKPKTNQEYISDLPDELRDVMNEGLLARNEKRGGLIEVIKANAANPFTDEQLSGKPTNELASLAILAGSGIPKVEDDLAANYAASVGYAYPTTNTEEPLLLPSIDFAKKTEKVA